MSKKRTQREMAEFFKNRAMRINMWRNAAGISRAALAAQLGVSEEMIRQYENPQNPAWLKAERLRKLRSLGCPAAILYLDGKILHELVLE